MGGIKRISALIMAFVLCLGLLGTGAQAQLYSDDGDIYYYNAVRTLTTLKIFNGEQNEDGGATFRPKDTITRAEFSKLVCILLNGGKEPVFGAFSAASFSDTQGHWASNYIESLYKMGYVSGYGNGIYGTEDKITAQQASKMLLTVIGFDAEREGLVGAGWADATDALASGRGFYNGLPLDFRSTDFLTREQTAQLFWNAINANMVTYNNGFPETVTGEQAKALTFFYTVTSIEGIVVANEYGHLFSEPDAPNPPGAGEGVTQRGTTYVKSQDNVNHFLDISTPPYSVGMPVKVIYFTDIIGGEIHNIVLSMTQMK